MVRAEIHGSCLASAKVVMEVELPWKLASTSLEAEDLSWKYGEFPWKLFRLPWKFVITSMEEVKDDIHGRK